MSIEHHSDLLSLQTCRNMGDTYYCGMCMFLCRTLVGHEHRVISFLVAYPSPSYDPHSSPSARSNSTSPLATPIYRLTQTTPLLPGSGGIYRDQYSTGDLITNVYPSGLGFSGSHGLNDLAIREAAGSSSSFIGVRVAPVSNRCLIPAGAHLQANGIEELSIELERGVELQAAVLSREGYKCLLRPEYQFQDNELISTTLRFQDIDLSPYEASPPPSSESPDSVLSHDGSVVSPQTHPTNSPIDSGHNSSLKRFKCLHPGCSYAADRKDHVKYHYQARHQGIYHVCDLWCVPNCSCSIIGI
jgi:hypothetical protein